MSIKWKFWAILLISSVGMIAVSVLAIVELKKAMFDERRSALVNLVEMAEAILIDAHSRYQAGELTEAAARREAIDAIRRLRYEDGNYVFLYDFDGTVLAFALNTAAEGKNFLTGDAGSEDARRVIGDIIDIARAGDGFYAYDWPKPNVDGLYPKLSYAKGFQPWSMMFGTGVYTDDLDARIQSVAVVKGMVAAAFLAVTLALIFGVSRSILRPIGDVTEDMAALAENKLDIDVRCTGRKDELGTMARALEVFKTRAREVQALQAAEVAQREQAAQERRALLASLADRIETSIGDIAAGLNQSAASLEAASQTMSALANHARGQTGTAVEVASSASGNVQTVASAAEELTASIREISQQVALSTEAAGQASGEAEATREKVTRLADSAERIGDVVTLIKDIAEQTNLLALNATIEAARAGEAGKGFAVVANEVKSLANQTGTATEEISKQIAAVQAETREAVRAIESIAGAVNNMSEVAAAIAAAVEEQEAATSEIARNVDEASQGVQMVSASVTEVGDLVGQTGDASSEVDRSSAELKSRAGELARLVREVVTEIRA